MSFQRRVMLASATAVAVAVAVASLVTYLLVRNDLSSHIDRSLHTLARGFVAAEHSAHEHGRPRPLHAATVPPFPYRHALHEFSSHVGDVTQIYGLMRSSGAMYQVFRAQDLTLTRAQSVAVQRLARAGHGTYTFTANIHGSPYRVLAAGVDSGYAVVVTHGLAETNSTLTELRLILLFLTLGGAALASVLGWFVTRTALAPVRRLTAAVEHVA
jgi:two-component system sensor histidine kinase MprB